MQVTFFYRCKRIKSIDLYILFLSLENFFIFILLEVYNRIANINMVYLAGSSAAQAGLRMNDCIIRLNGQNVSRSTADSVARIVRYLWFRIRHE